MNEQVHTAEKIYSESEYMDRAGGYEHEIGIECEDADRETAINALYRIARNLFSGELELFWKEGEKGKATF